MDVLTAKIATDAIARFSTSMADAVKARGGQVSGVNVDGHFLFCMDESGFDEIVSVATETAMAYDLVIAVEQRITKLRVAAFSPKFEDKKRTWVLFDLASDSGVKPTVIASGHGVSSEPPVFTIMGPEGAGKTTLCNNLIRIFSGYPIPFRQIHHTAEWKGGSMEDPAMRQAKRIKTGDQAVLVNPSSLSSRSGLLRVILRTILPQSLRNQLGSFAAEINYMKQFSGLIEQSRRAGQLLICDRYCYDRFVRWRNLRKPFGQRIASHLVCRVLRRPLYAFVLCDEPERIRARKPIMPLWEIEQHQRMLIAACERFNVPFETVNVTELDKDRLAEFVARRILELAVPGVFMLMDAGLTARKR